MGGKGRSRRGEDVSKGIHGLLLVRECDSGLDGSQGSLDGSSYNWGNAGFIQRTYLFASDFYCGFGK